MAAARSKAPAIGSAAWLVEERHQSNDLVAQEVEDFGFSVRNELEWLNEHMADIFAQNGQNNLDVFKTPGKLRGKTPRTTRKKLPAEQRQPLGDIISPNPQRRASPAQQSLQKVLHEPRPKAFHIAEDSENAAPPQSPAALKSPAPRLLPSALPKGKENHASPYRAYEDAYESEDDEPVRRPGAGLSGLPATWSPDRPATQDTAPDTTMNSQEDDIFSLPATQETQPTQPAQSFRSDFHKNEDERRETGDSFVSAKEALGSKRVSDENVIKAHQDDDMDVDERADTTRSDAQDTVVRHELSSERDLDMDDDFADFPQPPRAASEQYSISADTHDALDTAHHRAYAPEPKNLAPSQPFSPEHTDLPAQRDEDDEMEVDDDVRSPSDNSSPVKPLVRKSSLTFASLPAREPLLAKKSMGNRTSRTSHLDQNKARGSTLGRFTGGKSLGGSQAAQALETNMHDETDLQEERPESRQEEPEPIKVHNKTSTQRLHERINMLKQKQQPPKPIMTQSQSFASSQPKDTAPFTQAEQPLPASQAASQPIYPLLPPTSPRKDQDHDQDEDIEEDDDDWISPIRTAPAYPLRPPFTKSHSAQEHPSPAEPLPPRPISADLSTVVESTTPAGSPTSKKYMDGPLSASKAKFYSALRAAKEKIIGSSATSAQVKIDALAESPLRSPARGHHMRSPVRPLFAQQDSSDDVFSSPKRDVFGSPKRSEKTASIFSHLRSPSKESIKSGKSGKSVTAPGSPRKDDGRRTRSSSERERQRDREVKETKQKQRTEDRLNEMREKEQSKAAAHFQKSKAATAKTPSAMSSQSSIRQAPTAATKTPGSVAQQPQSRPGTTRMNTAPRTQDPDSADEMPPPPPPKSFLPTTGHKLLREPKKLVKAQAKEAVPKGKPQKILVATNSSRYGQAPPPAARNAPSAKPAQAAAPSTAQAPASKFGSSTSRPATAAAHRTATGTASRPTAAGPTRPQSAAAKVAPKPGNNRPRAQTAAEKPKAPAAPAPQPRADLAAARPVARMQTVQDANRINIPPINPAKPAKRPFQPETEETLHRPAKRPSQQARTNPITPAPSHHSQFAKGKIPFAESTSKAPVPQQQYPNGDDIKLPEIMTDSEDDDSDNEFEQPSWVNTPNLRELLANQQLVDPEQIFGPIAPLNMEAVFPNKERHKRFRDRTSSAYWANDQVTEEEKRKEREARERIVRDGAWTYNPSPRPGPSR
ncbi:hypothetical protein BS50DRAFT_193260 [Corynespora cassiicola Philippines]|uniref:Inner centromere protein ARK-binding domain-containing protein n=1 Tax=Corynespora cassiicola Philippines TaxID=1448308 RepID=A0A2T2P7P6_CORCC|nr:hypothetical protein BS50DRAFT_193260 [Corynespora cassiicola Philippines]